MITSGGEYRPERMHVRRKEKKRCILRIPCEDRSGREALFVETLDHSEGGIGIVYDGEKISVGNRVLVYIDSLNIKQREAEVVWLKKLNGDCAAGLRWA